MLNRRKPYRSIGLTTIEMLVIIIAIAVLFVIIFIAVRPKGRGHPYGLPCSTQTKVIHQSLVLWAEDYNGEFPNPLKISPETANKCAQKGNSTANIHSLMIWNNLFSPELVVCPDETSSYIEVSEDFDYGGQNTTLSPEDMWDYNFSCDISGKIKSARTGKYYSNVSYANMAMTTDRIKNEWLQSLNSEFAILSDRGPKDGIHDPQSISYKNHGTKKVWRGNVVFNDGHVEMVTEQSKSPYLFPVYDYYQNRIDNNIFAEDDKISRMDIWLVVFGDSDEKSVTPSWD